MLAHAHKLRIIAVIDSANMRGKKMSDSEELSTIQLLQRHLSQPAEETVIGYFHKPVAKKIVCKDGATISVQASEYHYCTPRSNYGPYSCVECGFPSVAPEKSLALYAEEVGGMTGSIYPYAPIEAVAEFIDDHGGILGALSLI